MAASSLLTAVLAGLYLVYLAKAELRVYSGSLPSSAAGYDVLIVGGGLSGTVMADLYARKHKKKVLMIDRRNHIGGNCFDYVDPETKILVSRYGAHLFHTRHERVWKYVNRFSKFREYEHRVVGLVDNRIVPIPVTIETVNILLNKHITSTAEMTTWITQVREEALGDAAGRTPQNSRDVGLQRVGQYFYDKIFHQYTKKQWDVYPEELGPEVLARIPVRESWDDRYFPDDPFQALPAEGYTKWFEKALDDPLITVVTGVDYFDLIALGQITTDHSEFEKVFFTGQIDQLLHKKGVDLPPLEYRSIRFESEVIKTDTTMQSAFVVNYPQFRYGNFTRIVEYKHAYQQVSDKTIAVKEYSSADGDPYYPFPNQKNKDLFEQYKAKATEISSLEKVHFAGRLANYKYYNMDDAIDAALKLHAEIEGQQSIAFIDDLPLPRLHEKMVVHLIFSMFNEPLQITKSVCSAIQAAFQNDVEVKIFIYSKHPDGNAARIKASATSLLQQSCPVSDIKVIKLPNVGRESHSWLTHMMSYSFEFGDANVFLRGTSQVEPSTIVSTLKAIQVRLFDRNATRASQPAIYNTDIQDVPSVLKHPSAESLQQPPHPHLPYDHHLHWRPLSAVHASFDSLITATSDPDLLDYLHRIVKFYCPTYEKLFQREDATHCVTGHAICERGEFIATDAGIRRMLAKHRTELSDILTLLSNSTDPIEGHVLERMWLRLFRYR